MELRLCSLVIARWYQTIPFGASIAGVQPPRDLPPILKRRVASDLAAAKDSAELHERLMDRLLWPRPLLSVDHADQLLAVLHAMACAGPLDQGRSGADPLIALVELRAPFSSSLPRVLTERSVAAVLPRPTCKAAERWVLGLSDSTYLTEVADMHGSDAVPYFEAMKRSITSAVSAPGVHGMELCCVA